jgi:hypothetical protein
MYRISNDASVVQYEGSDSASPPTVYNGCVNVASSFAKPELWW